MNRYADFIGFHLLLSFVLVGCKAASISGSFQEELPEGGQAMIAYERRSGDVWRIVHSLESTRHLIENSYFFERDKLRAVSSNIREIVRDENFQPVSSKQVAMLIWSERNGQLVLEDGDLQQYPDGRYPQFSDGDRLMQLVLRWERDK